MHCQKDMMWMINCHNFIIMDAVTKNYCCLFVCTYTNIGTGIGTYTQYCEICLDWLYCLAVGFPLW